MTMSSLLLASSFNGADQAPNNRLLALKSSFQSWKCVSFGCSLLATILLLSKLNEVSTDLQLLNGIDRVLMAQEMNQTKLSWPPVPIDIILPPASETNSSFGMESLQNNGTMLMSHMQMSLSRELNGNQLLRQEVGAFTAEFRMAKSTLTLSTLLVSVYIISWILMTLAINDTQISNDISLRNILLLSVFGAIDLAASIGFVMIRLIMFSVRSNQFTDELLGPSGLRDTPVRLSADQMTAFTALRLIAMRSCSAHVDLYVSTVVGLLTILRLYSILRAIAYYKYLRQLGGDACSSSMVSSRATGPDGQTLDQKQIWASSHLSAGTYMQGPGTPLPHAANLQQRGPQQPPVRPASYSGQLVHSTSSFRQPLGLSLRSPALDEMPQCELVAPPAHQSMSLKSPALSEQLIGRHQQVLMSPAGLQQQQQQSHSFLSNGQCLIKVSKKPAPPTSQRLLMTLQRSNQLKRQELASQTLSPATVLFIGEEPGPKSRAPAASPPTQATRKSRDPTSVKLDVEQQEESALQQQQQQAKRLESSSQEELVAAASDTPKASEQFTLLDAEQLDRLGRRLLRRAAGATKSGKYTLVATGHRARPLLLAQGETLKGATIYHTTGRQAGAQLLSKLALDQAESKRRLERDLVVAPRSLAGSSSGGGGGGGDSGSALDSSASSSSGLELPEDEDDEEAHGGHLQATEGHVKPEDLRRELRAERRQLRNKRRSTGTRQSEEFLVPSEAKRHSRLVELSSLNGSSILLNKYHDDEWSSLSSAGNSDGGLNPRKETDEIEDQKDTKMADKSITSPLADQHEAHCEPQSEHQDHDNPPSG